MQFEVGTTAHFRVTHCNECALPGYLIVHPYFSVASISDLPHSALLQLGLVLAGSIEVVQKVVAPHRIYCASFGEQRSDLHFHIFPRTTAVTEAFLNDFPHRHDAIAGPVLLDWARSHYRQGSADVWREVAPVIGRLREEFAARKFEI